MSSTKLIRSTFYIRGMHCASCEILIEKKIIKEPTVEMVDASLSKNQVIIEHQSGDRLTAKYLSKLFHDDHYRFSTTPFSSSRAVALDSTCAVPQSNPLSSLFIAGIIIIGFLFLDKTGLTSLVSVGAGTALPVFLIFGLLAGFSSCAALVGGIILSVSKQWVGNFGNSDDTLQKMQPHILFNTGRVVGYAAGGALLGLVGNVFQLSPLFTALLIIAVSAVMILLGLQMLGVRSLAQFQISLPKSITGSISDESNFTGKFAPFLMGALTFLLPCGFTITAQALALASGNPLTGALIMGLFAIGTIPGLIAIGYSSVKLHSNPETSAKFSVIAGYLVLFFALFNINNQLTVIGLPSFSSLVPTTQATSSSANTAQAALVPQVNGKQVITMTVTSAGYTPNQFTVKAGTPVSWQISNDGSAGCASSIVSQGLFSGRIDTIPGQTVTKEFTPTTPGVYRFSCTMGMYTGTITVIDANGYSGTTSGAAQPVGSGAKGCGCGGGGGNSCH
ncbi:sulfite exporter TauE/SafE family protein [Patescibacteria group bacterium]|nr:sulfite exporter TauE/SafE family protein [Patescibacteria group bacterium]